MLVELDTTPVRRLTPSGRSRGVPQTGPAQNLSPSKWRLNQVWCDVGWFNGCVYAQECSLMCFDKITNITIVETGNDGGGDVKQCFTDPIVIYPPDTHPPRPLNETRDQTGPQLLHCLNSRLFPDHFGDFQKLYNKVLKHKRFEKSLYSLLSPVTYL